MSPIEWIPIAVLICVVVGRALYNIVMDDED